MPSFNERIVGTNFPNDQVTYNNSAATILGVSEGSGSTRSDYRFNSFFGRLNYNYNLKYLLSFTFRRYGSSRFGENFRYGNFWAIGAGWNIANEPFMDNLDWLSLGKLRVSYGITGSDNVGNFLYIGAWEGIWHSCKMGAGFSKVKVLTDQNL